MNNVDKLVKQGLRDKYFREPTLKDISISWDKSWWREFVLFTIGVKERRVAYDTGSGECGCKKNKETEEDYKIRLNKNKLNLPTLKTLIEQYQITKTMETLEKICELLDIKSKSLFRKGYATHLLNKEGIKFVENLKVRLEKSWQKMKDNIQELEDMKAEICVISPYTKSLFMEKNNSHIRDIEWVLRDVKRILEINKCNL